VECTDNNENNNANYVGSGEQEETEQRGEDNNNRHKSGKPRKKLFSLKSNKVKGDLIEKDDAIVPSCSAVLTGHDSFVSTLDYDENLIISGSYDQNVIVWNESEGIVQKFIQVLPGGVHQVYLQNSLAFASGRASKEMKLLDIEAGKETVTYKGSDSGVIFYSIIDWEEQAIIVTDGKLLKIYDFRGGDHLHRVVLGKSIINRECNVKN